ncbi:MAG: recombinase family protein [Pseudomonadota bacterium]
MKKLIGYIRISDPLQKKGVSLQEQQDDIERFATANGDKITEWQVEQRTAAKTGRPVFDQVIAQLQAGKADGVVMHKIDRSSRNWIDWGNLIALSDQGMFIAFAVEGIDMSTDQGRLTADIYQAIATNFIRNLRSEAKKGQRGRLKAGMYPFHTPLGYLNGGKHTGKPKTPHPKKAVMVRRIFEEYATGEHSYRTLLKLAHQIGLTSHNENPITKHTLEIMLSNPFYCGIIHIQRSGETFQGCHEPIISAELYRDVQKVRAERQFKKTTKHNHLFRGLFKCLLCGNSMIAEKQKSYVYYRCHKRGCNGRSVREEKLDGAVVEALEKINLPNKLWATISDRVMHWHSANLNEQKSDDYAMRLKNVDDRLDRLDDAIIDGCIDKQAHSRRREKLLFERSEILDAQRKSENQHGIPSLIGQFLELVKSLAEYYKIGIPTEKREIVKLAFSNRTVFAGNVVVEPSNWLRDAQTAINGLAGDPHRTRNRTFEENLQIEKLADIAVSSEVQQLLQDFMSEYENAGDLSRSTDEMLRTKSGKFSIKPQNL